MDLTLLSNNSIKIKSKKANVIVDPEKEMSKNSADCVIVMNKDADPSRINDSRLLISGPGEYEVGGLKITGIPFGENTAYGLNDDTSADLFLSRASSVKNVDEKVRDYSIAIFNVDSSLNQTLITALEPRLVILYGEKAMEGAKLLGAENISPVSKYTFSEDKLSEEMQVVLLG